MITADQIVLHLIGDYVTQSDWMASEKTKRFWPAWFHAFVYAAPFMLLINGDTWWKQNAQVEAIIWTHFLIDRYRLARYVAWAKNFLAPRAYVRSWAACKDSFGYPPERPVWLACWLTIIADNVLHIIINGLVLAYL